MSEQAKRSSVERIKEGSNYLRGTIHQELLQDTPAFDKDTTQLLKFHGTYQQDDRDARHELRATGAGKGEKAYIFMVRSRVPGGRLTCEQFLAELDLCEEVGNATLRITSRQGLQLHGVLKQNLWRTIHRINEIKLSTLAACGDVERNIMCCPAPINGDPVHQQMRDLTDRLVAHLAPRTRAYHEIWLRDPAGGDEEMVATTQRPEDEIEPLYGKNYLPRKFKTAISLCGDNCVDVYANDLGFLAVCEDWNIVGYNVLVGGGMGMTPSAKKTFPAVAHRMAYIAPEEVLDVAAAVIKVQRDFGNRADRKVARLKYLIADWGLPKFKAKVEEYYGRKLADPHPADVHGHDDHMGWHEQGDGRWFYGLNIENGRIKDEGDFRLKTALREVCRAFAPEVRLTAHQSLLFCDLPAQARGEIEKILHAHGVRTTEETSTVRRWSMACVAWPTCGLSVTESERVLPGVIDRLEAELARLGLSKEVFTVRMTGCPNGCARPYNCDVGLVGRTQGKYAVYLGGRVLGDRLNFLYKDLVALEEITPTLVPLLLYFKAQRQEGERFGDFCHRKGVEDLTQWAQDWETQFGSTKKASGPVAAV